MYIWTFPPIPRGMEVGSNGRVRISKMASRCFERLDGAILSWELSGAINHYGSFSYHRRAGMVWRGVLVIGWKEWEDRMVSFIDESASII